MTINKAYNQIRKDKYTNQRRHQQNLRNKKE